MNLSILDNSTLIVEGSMLLEEGCSVYLSDNTKIIIRNGGSIVGKVNPGVCTVKPSVQIVVDEKTGGKFDVTNMPEEMKSIITYQKAVTATPAAPTVTPAAPEAAKTMAVTLKKTTYTANGKSIKPAVKSVKVNGKAIAKKYYKVTYKNNKKAGIGQVVVTGKGKYKALKDTVNFTINPAKSKITSAKAKKNTVTVKWKKQSGVYGYELQYSTNKNFTDAKSVYKVGYKTVKATLENLTSKTTYYVRVRSAVSVGNSGLFGNWSKVKKVKVK